MSWHYSQALGAAYSGANSSGGLPSAPASSTPTPAACSSPAKTTARSRPSRYGTTSAPSMESRGVAWWILSLVASRARTSPSPELAKDSTASAADSGPKWHESFARWDRATCSWKTPQLSLLEGSDVFSETWPRWGMMQRGECSALSMPELPTSESESGSWATPIGPAAMLPTPTATRYGNNQSGSEGAAVRPSLDAMASKNLWPTPTVCGNYNRKGASAQSGDGLATAVRQWPPPTAQDAKNNGAPSQVVRNTKPLNAEVGGPLNPQFVEWLMGWPLNWTSTEPMPPATWAAWCKAHGCPTAPPDCEASATAKCRQWCASHGVFYHRQKTQDTA